jgi:hypothetical protein
MAEDINEGVAYLAALKQGTGPQAGSAVAPAREHAEGQHAASAPAAAGEQFKGAEKRRSPRYKCEGSAEVREEGCDVHTWATFTDVSLHGCYVEAQATYPVGSKLHMKLEANGVRFETKGEVRVSYPYLGMGISFVDMTDENRIRLKQLLGTVTHAHVIVGPGVVQSAPVCGPMDPVPAIPDPLAAVQGLIHFFETRHMLTREDFLAVIRKSQGVAK